MPDKNATLLTTCILVTATLSAVLEKIDEGADLSGPEWQLWVDIRDEAVRILAEHKAKL